MRAGLPSKLLDRQPLRVVPQGPGKPPVGQHRPDPVPKFGDVAGLDEEARLTMPYDFHQAASRLQMTGVPLAIDSIAARPSSSEIRTCCP